MVQGRARRHWAVWIAAIFCANVVLAGITLTAGRSLPDAHHHPFLAGGPNCNTCWVGIAPGKTRIMEVTTLLNNAGLQYSLGTVGVAGAIDVQTPRGRVKAFMYAGFAGFQRDNRVAMLCLRDDEASGGLLLGDAVNELGVPDDVHFTALTIEKARMDLRYRDRNIEVSLEFDRQRLSLFSPVNSVCYIPDAAYPGKSSLDLPWQGAALLQHYYPDMLIK